MGAGIVKKNIIFGLITILFFVVYWNVLGLIWNLWVPFNPTTDIISLFIVTFINLPLSAISSQQLIKVIKSS
jgi:hypothetical protein